MPAENPSSQLQPELIPPSAPKSAREWNRSLGVLSSKLRKNYGFFAGLSEDELVRFLRACNHQAYQRGEVIFEEGEREGEWFIILTGRVTIHRGEIMLGHLAPGECFGEVGLLKNAPRSASARADAETILLCVPRKILYKDMPSLALKLLEYLGNQLADKLSRANIRIENPPVDKFLKSIDEGLKKTPPEDPAK